jgi:hypothetical protein
MLLAGILALAPVLVRAGSGTAEAASGATIVHTWKDAKGRTIILRQGVYQNGKGFGWAKIRSKHSINSLKTLEYISRAPNGGEAQGSDRLYIAYANKTECKGSYCRVVDSIPVRLVVNFDRVDEYWGVKLNAVLGVKTAYCVNDDRAHDCPSWVDQALGK